MSPEPPPARLDSQPETTAAGGAHHLERLSGLASVRAVVRSDGALLGQRARTWLFQLADDETAMGSQVVDKPISSLFRSDAGPNVRVLSYRTAGGAVERHLHLDGGRLVGVWARGDWANLASIQRMLLEAKELAPWQARIFAQHGEIDVQDDARAHHPDDTVCLCNGTTYAEISEAIRSGSGRPDRVAVATGAGALCGSCLTLIDALCGRPSWQPAVIQEAFDVAEDIRSFRIVPCAGQKHPARPGEFLPLGVLIDGAWVDRNYTITAPGENLAYYEITVENIEGPLARRLFGDDGDGPLLRVARPRGNFRLRDDEADPVLFFAGGIGITPALAFCRAIVEQESGRTLHVDYSVSRKVDACYVREFQSAARRRAEITFTLRCTQSEGRIGSEAVRGLLARYPDAICYLCGPGPYIDDVTAILEAAGLPRDRIRTESFVRRPRVRPNCPEAGRAKGTGRPERDRARRVRARSFFTPVTYQPGGPQDDAQEAQMFLRQFHYENDDVAGFEARWRDVRKQLEAGRPYRPTCEELGFGCRLAWRNATACIGRNFWGGLQVRDRRTLETEEAVFEEIKEHLRIGYDGGNIRSVATVLDDSFLFWGDQACRYAGYRRSDGSVVGDPQSVAYTQQAIALGWTNGAGTPFDVLPVIIQQRGKPPKLFDIPPELAFQVRIEHPSHDWFSDLGLRWFAIPLITYLKLSLGGREFTLPFNGWYTGPEIGTRNLADADRYNILPAIAERMELDTRRSATLWKDRAILELNAAVIHSYEKAGVKIMDHHAAADSFLRFDKAESDAGRSVYGCREMLLPALSPSSSPVFHRAYEDLQLKPHLLPRQRPW